MSGTVQPAYRQGFPEIGAMIVDPRTGLLTQPWMQFFVALWNRTGGAAGGSIVDIEQAVAAIPGLAMDGPTDDALSPAGMSAASALAAMMFSETGGDAMQAGSDDACDTAVLKAIATAIEDGGGVGAGAGADTAGHPGYVPGRFYPVFDGNVSASGAVSAADTLYLYPFRIFRDVAMTAWFFRVVTAGSADSAGKFGIWRNDGGAPAGFPVAVDDAGVPTASTGVKNVAFPGLPLTLPKGWYWAGAKFTGATRPVCTNIPGNALLAASRIGGSSAGNAVLNGATNQMPGLSMAHAYALPMPDLTGAALGDVAIAAAGIPVMGFGVQ